MGKESTQKKIGRVRPPRVHITYEVETGGAIEKRELPFVVGVLADLSGQPAKSAGKLADRRFTEIDGENFNQVMEKQEPRLAFKVKNTLSGDDSRLGIELKFKSMNDFQPDRVARQVEPLRKLVDLREKLSNLRSSLYGNDKLEELLKEAVHETEELRKSSSSQNTAEEVKEG